MLALNKILDMQEFILLFRGGKTNEATDEQLDNHEQSWDSWMDHLEAEGVLIDGLPMQDMGVIITKDGMQEADCGLQEGVTGYLIIECKDIDHVTELTNDCPIFEFDGKVELRQLINERG